MHMDCEQSWLYLMLPNVPCSEHVALHTVLILDLIRREIPQYYAHMLIDSLSVIISTTLSSHHMCLRRVWELHQQCVASWGFMEEPQINWIYQGYWSFRVALLVFVHARPIEVVAKGAGHKVTGYSERILYSARNYRISVIYAGLEIAVGHWPFSDPFASFGRANPIC